MTGSVVSSSRETRSRFHLEHEARCDRGYTGTVSVGAVSARSAIQLLHSATTALEAIVRREDEEAVRAAYPIPPCPLCGRMGACDPMLCLSGLGITITTTTRR